MSRVTDWLLIAPGFRLLCCQRHLILSDESSSRNHVLNRRTDGLGFR